MLKQIEEHILEIEKFEGDTLESVEHFRIKYLGKKGVLNDLFLEFKNVPNEEKKAFGQALNKLKIKAQEKVDALQQYFVDIEDLGNPKLDLTMSAEPLRLGTRHPLPLQMLHEISTSALGSVNGKYEGLSLIFVSFPKNSWAK